MAVTMAEVAHRAGVGIGTVSRVVNNSASVREETRQRVLATINELGYRQTRIAHALIHKGAYAPTVGLLSPLFTLQSHQLLIQGVHQVAASRGYHLLLLSPPPGADLAVALERAIRQFHVDGMMLLAEMGSSSEPIRKIIGPMMPVVCANRLMAEIPSVYADNHAGGRLAGEYLWQRGCRRPAMIALPKYPARRLGFVEFFRQHGVDTQECHTAEITEFSEHEGGDLTDVLLRAQPDGFFFASDVLAVGGLNRLRTAGQTVPVVGYDNLDFAGPMGLTTIDHQYENIGRISFELLVQQIEGHRSIDPARTANRVLTPQLVVRQT